MSSVIYNGVSVIPEYIQSFNMLIGVIYVLVTRESGEHMFIIESSKESPR